MSDFAINLFAFILVLGFLIFAHEGGHFFMAKLFKVRVLVFSFGFGKRLFGFQRGDTDYRVSLIPLGGYVRMAGDTPDEGGPIAVTGSPDEFLSKPKWQRFLILFAGPAMNIVIAIGFLAAIHMIGAEYRVVRPVIGQVVPGKAAAKAGLQPGDTIVRVGTESIDDFEDLRLAITLNAGTPLRVEYLRKGQFRSTVLTPQPENSDFGQVGKAGIRPHVEPVVGQVRQGSPAWKAGIRTGDRIVTVDGKPVDDISAVDDVLSKAPSAPLTLGLQRGGIDRTATGPERGGPFEVKLPAVNFNPQDPYRGFLPVLPPVEVRKLSPVAALKESVRENWKMLKYAVRAIGRIFRAEGSVRELSGPIDIARISGEMLRRGWIEVVVLMVMISLQLGVLNLLPIPVLDGGHIAILLIEGVVRRDLSLRVKERIQQLGFAVLAALMIVVLYNDVVKNVARISQG